MSIKTTAAWSIGMTLLAGFAARLRCDAIGAVSPPYATILLMCFLATALSSHAGTKFRLPRVLFVCWLVAIILAIVDQAAAVVAIGLLVCGFSASSMMITRTFGLRIFCLLNLGLVLVIGGVWGNAREQRAIEQRAIEDAAEFDEAYYRGLAQDIPGSRDYYLQRAEEAKEKWEKITAERLELKKLQK